MAFKEILVWWFLVTFLGLIATPPVLKIFKWVPDRGYAFTKPLGLLFLGLLSWLFGFIRFSNLTILLAAAILAFFSYKFWNKNRQDLLVLLKQRIRYILLVELFFLALFLIFLSFRMYTPEIMHTEKFMDMAFLNCMTRVQSFPPYDPWFSGPKFFINYYYFGYLLMAILIKLSAVGPATGFNLALGLLFALSGTACFGLLYNLTKKISFAFAGWFGIFLFGNLAGARQVFNGQNLRNFDWWSPSRVIPGTINEFPFFSFLLGDLHPHVLVIPYVFVALALALNQLQSGETDLSWRDPEKGARFASWGLVLGSLGFINSWDLPTVYCISIAALFFNQYRLRSPSSVILWRQMLAASGILLFFTFVPYLPFYLNFHGSQVKGVSLTSQNTRISDYLLIYGFFLFGGLSFVFLRYQSWFNLLVSGADRKNQPRPGLLNLFFERPWGLSGNIAARLSAYYWLSAIIFIILAGLLKSTFLAVMVFLLFLLFPLLNRYEKPEVIFIFILLFTAWFLTFVVEIVHIKDRFQPPLDRMNTVFKFYYQIWILAGIAGIYGVYRIFSHLRNLYVRFFWLALMALLTTGSLIYPYCSIRIRTNDFSKFPTLDGSLYMKARYPDDWKAITWMNKNLKNNPVILEAVGSDYSDFSRVSTFTGLPAVLGWSGHEWQWRGKYKEIAERISDIDQLYTTSDDAKIRQLLDKYKIEYVFVGTLEHYKYPQSDLNKFSGIMEKVYENSGAAVYRKL